MKKNPSILNYLASRFALAVAMTSAAAVAVPVLAAEAVAPAGAPATAAPSATTAPAPAGMLKVYVVAVEGIVNIRRDENSKWEKAVVGMQFGEGAEVRTGPRSAVQLKVEPNQVVTLDRLGSCKIARAMFENGKVTTDVVMPYGRVRYDVESAGVEHDCKVHTPSSTLAIRGTQTIVYDQPPFAPELRSLVGAVRGDFARQGRQGVAFGGTQDARMTDENRDPGDHARDETMLDTGTPRARTPLERQLVVDLPSQNGQDLAPRIRPPRPRPRVGGGGDGTTGNFIAGEVLFTAEWVGTADIDLFVKRGTQWVAAKDLGTIRTTTVGLFDATNHATATSLNDNQGSMYSSSVSPNIETIRLQPKVPLGNYVFGAYFQGDSYNPSSTTPVEVTLKAKYVKGSAGKILSLPNTTVNVNRDTPKQGSSITVTANSGNGAE